MSDFDPDRRKPSAFSRKTYFYINSPGGRRFPEKEMIALDRAGYTVVLSRVAIDSVPSYVPASGRKELSALLRRIAPDELLVVLELASLGCSARDVLSTVTLCSKAKIAIRCVELGGADLTASPEPQAIKALRAIVNIEQAARSERSASSLKTARDSGRPTGRPASLSSGDQQRIVRALRKGVSVSEVARRFGTSRQTVMRVRSSSLASA